MTGYHAQIQLGFSVAHCISLLTVLTQRPTAESQQLPTVSGDYLQKKKEEEEERPPTATQQLPTVSGDYLKKKIEEEEEERPPTATQHLPTVSRRSSPNEVRSLTISHQQAHPALLKLGKRPKKLEELQVNPTYQPKKKSQTHHKQVPVPNKSD